ncbi:zinc-binding alcohol dehydrogenase family protein [Gluconobacter sp. Dm-44]|uniref:zinc-binding alcohol dehydrogenase family protein n=1 Tax=Gluconobacter sp. Dm-44 TaxID=2799805 RepID=UPI001B8BCDC4|nr:zinc-binding alcohol dehydrogenase family protein [Gluconobacter sp. Dm-44]MBS1060392.1 zinc-binding alcohol dehydrogenase family protein [Gluconobacter sp. Dm-44]
MPSHEALILGKKRGLFEIRAVPDTAPGTDEILVSVRAVAVNPFERLIQSVGDIITPYMIYPAILGSDVAGEVIAVGSNITRFRVGDRVAGFAAGAEKGRRSAEGGFQEQVILLEKMTTPLPDDLSFEAGSVLPLALTTAASGLFQSDFLGMRHPSTQPVSTGQTLIVWGGSTSVGCNAIQLAVAAGYDVITTSSLHNAPYLKSLGARVVYDRHCPSTPSVMIEELRGREVCGALTIGTGSAKACIDILGASKGQRFIALATPPGSFDEIPAGRGRWQKLIPALMWIVAGNISLTLRARRKGVKTKFIWGGSALHNDVGPMIYREFLPSVLESGQFRPAPEPEIVGHGLEVIPEALERQRKGVSARKLVVTLGPR